jgi:hypothetical protein
VIEAARKKGKLETVQSFRFPFYEQVQVQNPEKPNDPNSKIWEHRIRGIEVKAYDVDGDKDKKPDYVAVFKMEGKYKDGKLVFENPSETPSIQIFKSPGSSNPNLIVIDKDGDTIPDEVNKIFGVNTASDLLFSKKAETLDRLFSERGKDPEEEIAEFRKGYHLPKQSFGVAMVGETKIEEFRINDSGWPLPQFKYKNSQGSNYKVEIVLGGSHHENDSKENPYREIKYFKKVYHSPNNQYQDVEGKVVEYFKPPKEYSDKDVREAKVEGTNNQTISIHRKGKTNETWHIDDILKGSSAFAIEYDSGDKREIIVDKDGDKEKDSRYEAKKLFTPGKDKVPVITSPEGGYE